jgi:hypothetical protein
MTMTCEAGASPNGPVAGFINVTSAAWLRHVSNAERQEARHHITTSDVVLDRPANPNHESSGEDDRSGACFRNTFARCPIRACPEERLLKRNSAASGKTVTGMNAYSSSRVMRVFHPASNAEARSTIFSIWAINGPTD